jgi:hypothetical protein
MNWPRLLASFVILVGFAGCAPAADGPRHGPETPMGKVSLAALVGCTDRTRRKRAFAPSAGLGDRQDGGLSRR